MSMTRRNLFMLAATGAVIVAATAAYVARSQALFAPEVQPRSEDYAETRKHFHTRLLRAGPSPQREVFVLRRPDYVDEVEYPSGPLRLKAWIAAQPHAAHALPAVVFLHGGFEFGAADWDMAVPYWEAGFVLMAPMLRGENGQDGTFSFLYDEVDDVVAAADFLSTYPGVDPSRIFLAGHSSGATLTLLAIEASGRFRAAASFDGSPDQQLLYNGSAKKPGNHREIVFDPTDARELQVRSPLAYVASVKSPIRLFFSDEAASITERPSRRFAELAHDHGIDARAERVRGSHMSHVARAMPSSVRYFKTFLDRSLALQSRTVPPIGASLVGNTTFTLPGHQDARAVALAGSFNGWDSQHVLFGRENGNWICRVDLPPGKYLYQFVIDDDWINDPANPRVEDSGNGGDASVIVKE